VRYDACIIGAGTEGLAAAATLAGRGLKVAVLEREAQAGGRAATRQFHPGFHASPFADELPEIPADIFRALDLARRGAILAPAPMSLALWPDRQSLFRGETGAEAQRRAVIARALADADTAVSGGLFARRAPHAVWPGEALAGRSLVEEAGEASDRDHLTAALLGGRACDPALGGSALQLLAGRPGGMVAGGLGRLGEALRSAALEAGAEISCGLEVSDLKRKGGRVSGAGLADGSQIAARAIISTLDLKRTFLSLFTWSELPPALVERVGGFRPAPGMARLLLALDAPPDLPAGTDTLAWRGPIHLSPGAPEEALAAWRRGALPKRPPAMLRLVSAVDPSLAPAGRATMTLTLGAIAHTPFDGPWTKDKRDALQALALAAVEEILPGTARRVVGSELIVPPDIETMLGATAGDLTGGAFDADQMLGFRPFADCSGARTPIEGLYLAGPSSALGPLATCASGVAAAHAVMADFSAGRLR